MGEGYNVVVPAVEQASKYSLTNADDAKDLLSDNLLSTLENLPADLQALVDKIRNGDTGIRDIIAQEETHRQEQAIIDASAAEAQAAADEANRREAGQVEYARANANKENANEANVQEDAAATSWVA